MDQVGDLRIEPRELAERGFRFIKVPAALLLNRAAAPSADIHPADFSDLLGRFGIDLIAEKIEREGTVVDLLDYDVRFGQGALFSPPRPVRTEVLQGLAERVQGAPPPPRAGSARARTRRCRVRRATGVRVRSRSRALARGANMPSVSRRSHAASFGAPPRRSWSMLITDHFSTLAPGYDAVLSDVWGVIHNGVAAFPAASEALTNFRQKGGAVVLISNAPRPGNQVIRMLDRMGVPAFGL